jgi:hypothetical protein
MSGVATGALQARARAAGRSAAVVAALAVVTLVTAAVGVVGFALAGYLALRPSMPDYQAASIVSAIFALFAGACVLAIAARLKRRTAARSAMPADTAAGARPAPPGMGPVGGDPVVRLISTMVQSPAIMSALALGIAAGRATKRSRRD